MRPLSLLNVVAYWKNSKAKLVPKNCLRCLQATLIMRGGWLVSEFMWGIVATVWFKFVVSMNSAANSQMDQNLRTFFLIWLVLEEKMPSKKLHWIKISRKIICRDISGLAAKIFQNYWSKNTLCNKLVLYLKLILYSVNIL